MVKPHSWADIDRQALLHNLARVRELAPGKRVCTVIKANAYGHGVHALAETLMPRLGDKDLAAVATLSEALALSETLTTHPILILRGPLDAEEMDLILHKGFHWTLHSVRQADLLKHWLSQNSGKLPALNIWLKLNTGMNRLGLYTSDLQQIWHWLQSLYAPGARVLMSHFATADETGHALAQTQQLNFNQMTASLPGAQNTARSLSASAGIIALPRAHHDIVRPGIMLYGVSPMEGHNGADEGLLPVMSLKSRLLTINQIKAGETVGYGASYQCPEDMPIGVVGIGYGDGYPRHVPSGTPVLIHAAGKVWQAPLAGRVSMDVLTVDLRGIPAQPGDEVLLWGQAWGNTLPAETIALQAGTIAYELFCQITSRVKLFYR